MDNKNISITVTDASTIFKIKSEKDYPEWLDFVVLKNNILKLTPEGSLNRLLYFYCHKMNENNEALNVLSKISSFVDSIKRIGWETFNVNSGEFIVFKSNPDNDSDIKNYNVSATIKSLYQESTIAIMTLQSQLDEYYYGEDYDGYDITVNFIIYNDNYIFSIKALAELYPEIRINIITPRSRMNFFRTAFDGVKQVVDILDYKKTLLYGSEDCKDVTL